MATPRPPKEKKAPARQARQPGAPAPKPADTESDADKAIIAGKAGGTHKVAKHPPVESLPQSKVKGDPDRPRDMPVNAKGEVKYEDAMKALQAGTLKRSVLTERGWVVAPGRKPPGRV